MSIGSTTVDKDSTTTDNELYTFITFRSITTKLSDKVFFIAIPLNINN